jgi:murein DD-endopeptidase MepM/ murein hydrolase activator NlpD
LKVIPHQGGDVRSIRLSMKAIKCGAAGLLTGALLFVGAISYSTYNLSLVEQDKNELVNLRQVNNLQQTQILHLSKKVAAMQSDMEELEELEGELRQLTGIEKRESEEKSGGQGGPFIEPNADNLQETLNIIASKTGERKENLEEIKRGILNRQEQASVTPSIWPTSGDVSSRYGLRWGGSEFHAGLDIAAEMGTPVLATADGVVIDSGWNAGGYGYMVDIDHGNGIVTRYAHNSQLAVTEGMNVRKGQVVAYVGSTGYSTGPHLHYEVRINGRTVNPENYL